MKDVQQMREAARAWRANAIASGETVRAHDKIDELINEIERLTAALDFMEKRALRETCKIEQLRDRIEELCNAPNNNRDWVRSLSNENNELRTEITKLRNDLRDAGILR